MNSITTFAFFMLGLTALIGLRAAYNLVHSGYAGPSGASFRTGLKLCWLLVGVVFVVHEVHQKVELAQQAIAAVQDVAQPLGGNAYSRAFNAASVIRGTNNVSYYYEPGDNYTGYHPQLAQYAPAALHMQGRAPGFVGGFAGGGIAAQSPAVVLSTVVGGALGQLERLTGGLVGLTR